ncbi:MAG: class I SAM-dependent methyltransferase [Candidatus Absconditabacterales bacterium]
MNTCNKTMDSNDLTTPEAQKIIKDLNELITNLKSENLKISSWVGVFSLNNDFEEKINRGYNYKSLNNVPDDENFPWFLYWEIVWLVLNNDFKQGQRVLDLGGSSSLFSYYLASRGLKVVTIDKNKELVNNANFVAKEKNWDLKNYNTDINDFQFSNKFDHIVSVCVYEHILLKERIEINKKIKNHLTNNGKFSITFDYRNPSKFVQINNQEDINNQFIKPSNLSIRGNKQFFDNKQNYLLHPFYYKNIFWKAKITHLLNKDFGVHEIFKTKNENDYTFGSLFLENNL